MLFNGLGGESFQGRLGDGELGHRIPFAVRRSGAAVESQQGVLDVHRDQEVDPRMGSMGGNQRVSLLSFTHFSMGWSRSSKNRHPRRGATLNPPSLVALPQCQ